MKRLLIVLMVLVAASNIVITNKKADAAPDLPFDGWAKIPLSDKTTCSDGSEYYIYARRGTTDNLIIHFSGGGISWNAKTATHPITFSDTSGYYFANIWPILQPLIGGIFQENEPTNPFKDWNVAYIPYCTADLHIGAAVQTYPMADGKTFTIRHNGRQNATEALAWIFDTFKQPKKLLISGDSAGGVATTFWTPFIARHYAESQTYQLADGAFLPTPKWDDIANNVWKADLKGNFGFEAGDDIAASAFLHDMKVAAPNVSYLHIDTVYDSVLIYFNDEMNDVPKGKGLVEAWTRGLRGSMQRLAEGATNYHYYLTDYGKDAKGLTPHTSIAMPLFYQIKQDNVALVDWLRRNVIDGEKFSVGEAFLK